LVPVSVRTPASGQPRHDPEPTFKLEVSKDRKLLRRSSRSG
jgi:hypothetical protein